MVAGLTAKINKAKIADKESENVCALGDGV
jgi:hypothetical protein